MENNKPKLLLSRPSFFERHEFHNPQQIDISREKVYLIDIETELIKEIRILESELSSAKNQLSNVKDRIENVEDKKLMIKLYTYYDLCFRQLKSIF